MYVHKPILLIIVLYITRYKYVSDQEGRVISKDLGSGDSEEKNLSSYWSKRRPSLYINFVLPLSPSSFLIFAALYAQQTYSWFPQLLKSFAVPLPMILFSIFRLIYMHWHHTKFSISVSKYSFWRKHFMIYSKNWSVLSTRVIFHHLHSVH